MKFCSKFVYYNLNINLKKIKYWHGNAQTLPIAKFQIVIAHKVLYRNLLNLTGYFILYWKWYLQYFRKKRHTCAISWWKKMFCEICVLINTWFFLSLILWDMKLRKGLENVFLIIFFAFIYFNKRCPERTEQGST